MDALDRGAPFPVPAEDLCERCRSFVESLDLAAEACRWIDGGELSAPLRARIESALESSESRPPADRGAARAQPEERCAGQVDIPSSE